MAFLWTGHSVVDLQIINDHGITRTTAREDYELLLLAGGDCWQLSQKKELHGSSLRVGSSGLSSELAVSAELERGLYNHM